MPTRRSTAPESVVAIGGGTRNALLMRIKASVTNLSHHVIAAEEATALGAALLGGLGAGVYPDVDEAIGIDALRSISGRP